MRLYKDQPRGGLGQRQPRSILVIIYHIYIYSYLPVQSHSSPIAVASEVPKKVNVQRSSVRMT